MNDHFHQETTIPSGVTLSSIPTVMASNRTFGENIMSFGQAKTPLDIFLHDSDRNDRSISSLRIESLQITDKCNGNEHCFSLEESLPSTRANKSKSEPAKNPSKGPLLLKRKTSCSYKTPIRYRKSYNSQHLPAIPLSMSPMMKNAAINGTSIGALGCRDRQAMVGMNAFFSSPDKFVLSMPPNIEKNSMPPPPPIICGGAAAKMTKAEYNSKHAQNHTLHSAPVALRPKLRRYFRTSFLHEPGTPVRKHSQQPFSTPENGLSHAQYSFIPIREDELKYSQLTPVSSAKNDLDLAVKDQLQQQDEQITSLKFTTPSRKNTGNPFRPPSSSKYTPMSNESIGMISSLAKGTKTYDFPPLQATDLCTPTNLYSKGVNSAKSQDEKHQLLLPVLAMP